MAHSVLTKAAPGSKRSTIELSHLGKSQCDDKRQIGRNSESQIEAGYSRNIETICPFGGLSQGLKGYAHPQARRAQTLPEPALPSRSRRQFRQRG
jgi:hypothetical protein